MRKAYLGRFTKGKMKGKPLVGKVFKDDVPGGAECHHDFDRAIIGKATEVVDRWNKREATKKIWVNGHKVARVTLGGRKVLMQVERKIPRFRKFNSNMGWIPPEDEPWVNETWWFEVAQALSHYSYHTTNRQSLLCDLQGGFHCLDPAPCRDRENVHNNGLFLTPRSTAAGGASSGAPTVARRASRPSSTTTSATSTASTTG